MPEKRDPDATYGQKLLRLFADLLFTGKKRSLSELAKTLDCFKQTVKRLVDDITHQYSVTILHENRDKQSYFWIERPKQMPVAPLSSQEIAVLELCRAFSRNLLGEKNYQIATTGIQKSLGMLPVEEVRVFADELGALSDGRIDYTPFREMLESLLRAGAERRVCKVQYQGISSDEAREFIIMPLKIFSHKDTVYVQCRCCTETGQAREGDSFDPLLALHRFKDIQVLSNNFEYPKDFDFEATFAQSFGVMKDEAFRVKVEFRGWSARYISERIWSPDQKIINKRDGGIRLEFMASSEAEVMGWVLSFGEEARVVAPAWLRKKLLAKLREMVYGYELEFINPKKGDG